MSWDLKPYIIKNGISISILLLLLLLPRLAIAQQVERFEYNSRHMGTTFRIVLYTDSKLLADSAANAAFTRIEELNSILSDYNPESELNRLSRTSGKDTSVVVSEPLFEVLKHAQRVSRQTNGAFDVTVGPYVQLWRQMNRQINPELPSDKILAETSEKVGYRHLQLNKQKRKVRLTRSNMRLDLGGIAKGYATDEALYILKQHGIRSALVDGGGDILLGDPPPDKPGWNIEIYTHEKSGPQNRLALQLSNKAVATSGDLYQYIEIGDKRYSHIIDPRTGLGLTVRRQVTVIAPDGIAADSYASAASVLEPKNALQLIEGIPDIALFIEQNTNAGIKRFKSTEFEKLLKEKIK